MSFIIDKQTLDDLGIFGKNRGESVYNLFNSTQTRGGALLLEEMFRYPLSDAAAINKRSSLICFFCRQEVTFPFPSELFDTTEHYLSNTDNRSRLAPGGDTIRQKFNSYLGSDTEYTQVHKGVLALIEIIRRLDQFIQESGLPGDNVSYTATVAGIRTLIDQFTWVASEYGTKKLPYDKTAEYDRLLRYESQSQLRQLLSFIYQLDVYIAVATVARKRGFVFAEALPVDGNTPTDGNSIKISGLCHPLLSSPVPNTVDITSAANIIFLTGANMAGKSTFMKSFGIAIFLAHMGFPVPAGAMVFTVQDGMYTTINLPDNLSMGYSHFYAEVLRLKKVAGQVSRSQNLVIIFDELFRGTNVKDAYDATVAVTEAFARRRNCTFVISTHIVEAGETLKGLCGNVSFVYLPTTMQGDKPVYTYKLKEGITNDRHGMMIINNEHIIEIIKGTETLTK